jgi:hypothetical protein
MIAPAVLHDKRAFVVSVIGSYVSHSRWIVVWPVGVLYDLKLGRGSTGMNICGKIRGGVWRTQGSTRR